MTDNTTLLKKQAALFAVDYVQPGMVVGLGTGSTAQFAVREIARRVKNGLDILAIPTSERTARLATSLSIPLTTLHFHPHIDLTIDGADEIDLSSFHLIKGLGGALLREKIVASASLIEVLIVDQSKIVPSLGLHTPLSVEVIPFGYNRTFDALAALGCQPTLRLASPPPNPTTPSPPHSSLIAHRSSLVTPFLTDSGNYLLDCKFPSIPDPPALAASIKAITGVVDHGLFIDLASRVVIASPSGIQVVNKSDR